MGTTPVQASHHKSMALPGGRMIDMRLVRTRKMVLFSPVTFPLPY